MLYIMVYNIICNTDLDHEKCRREKNLGIWNEDISTNFDDTLYFPHYKPQSSMMNEYRQTTTEYGQKKENRIFGIFLNRLNIQLVRICDFLSNIFIMKNNWETIKLKEFQIVVSDALTVNKFKHMAVVRRWVVTLNKGL